MLNLTVFMTKVFIELSLFIYQQGIQPTTNIQAVLNLHGLLSNATQQQSITQFDNIADSKGFILVYPNGKSIGNSSLNKWETINNSDVDFLSNLVDSIHSNYSTNNCLFVSGNERSRFSKARWFYDL